MIATFVSGSEVHVGKTTYFSRFLFAMVSVLFVFIGCHFTQP